MSSSLAFGREPCANSGTYCRYATRIYEGANVRLRYACLSKILVKTAGKDSSAHVFSMVLGLSDPGKVFLKQLVTNGELFIFSRGQKEPGPSAATS